MSAQSYFTFEQRSEPEGIFTSQVPTLYPVDTVLQTVNASLYSSGYSFAYWSTNGNRAADILGQSLPMVQFTLMTNTTAIALYLLPLQDADGDGFADYLEWRYCGNTNGPPPDSDADGFLFSEELARGYCPVVRDTLADGGLMLRLSDKVTVRDEAQKKRYEIRSDPQGIVGFQSGYTNTGASVVTPAIAYGSSSSGYVFGYWEVDGVRQASASGVALPQATLVMSNDVVAIARYFSTADTDADGLADWQEQYWFGDLTRDQDCDPDGDGFTVREELARGYNYMVRDTLADGGLMLRLSDKTTVGLSYYPRVAQVLVGGIMQAGFVAMGGASGSLGSASNSAPALADWDGDLDPDLVVGGASGQLRFYRNDGSPSVANFVADAEAGAAMAYLWTNLNDVAPAMGDWSGDGLADLAIGGDTNMITLVSSTGNFSDPASGRFISFLFLTNAARAIPALAPVGTNNLCDLFVLRDDGSVDLFRNTGIAMEPFAASNCVLNVLGAAVPDATGLAVADMNEDGLPDVLVSDQSGSIREFRGLTNLTFASRGRGFAGSYAGFAERLTLAADDLDGDGDEDLVAGFSQGGLIYMRNPSRRLLIDPPSQTAFCGQQKSWSAQNASGAVTWALVRNTGGSTIDPTSGTYTAGTNGQTMDTIEAVDSAGLRGRAYVNVISTNDVARAGKAIIVAGRVATSDPVWPTSQYLANYAYNTLLYRGFAKQNIQYLSPVPGKDVDGDGLTNDIAGLSTLANLEAVLTNWVGNSERLFIYLVDHGGESQGHGYFRLNPNETLSAAQLNQWLNNLQDLWGAELVIVIDCCNSGSFLPELAYGGVAKRIIVTSCRNDEPTVFVAGGLVSFSEAFFSGIMLGQNVREAFGFARSAVAAYQTGWLDDNKDGVYTVETDGAVAAGIRVGATFVAGKDIPQIGQVMGNQTLAGETQAVLWGGDVVSVYPIEQVWCLVVPPSHQPNPTNPVVDLPNLPLAFNPGTGRYEGQFNGFSENGTYSIIYYARDIWGSVSQPRQSYIVQDGFKERAILLAGGPTNAPAWASFNTLARFAFGTARNRRLSADSILVMNSMTPQDFDTDNLNDVDAPPTLAGLAHAMTNWTLGANRLTLYLVGGATNGAFQLNEAEVLLPSTLDSWLQVCQQGNTEVCVVMDFDGAGTYLMPLSSTGRPKRLCVASASLGQPARMLNGGMVSFSMFYFDYVFSGFDVWASFLAARDKIYQATGRRQQALLDSDGDGQYVPKKDGPGAQNWYLGSAFRTGDDAPTIDSVNPDTILQGTNCLTLWAAGVAAMDGVSNVVCLITPPDYDGTSDLIQIRLSWNADAARYESLYCGFTNAGTYICTFLATDLKGRISAPLQSEVLSVDAFEPDDEPATATVSTVGDAEQHSFHSQTDEDWVKFYAPTGLIFNIEARQLGTNSDVRVDAYCEQSDGSLAFVDATDDYGPGEGLVENLTLDLKSGLSELLPGVYYVRVSSADTNLFGPGSEYELRITLGFGGSGGVVLLMPEMGTNLFTIGSFYVYLGPPQALAARAGWRIQQATNENYFSDSSVLYGLPASPNWILTFRDIPGFLAPTNRSLLISSNQTTSVMAYYLYTNLSPRADSPVISTNGALQLTFLAYAGKRYAVEESTNLLQWVSLVTNHVPQDGLLHFNRTNWAAGERGFYRARLVP